MRFVVTSLMVIMFAGYILLGFVSVNSNGLSSTAKVSAAPAADSSCEADGFLGFPHWYKYIKRTGCDFSATQSGSSGSTPVGASEDWIGVAGGVALAIIEMLLRLSGLVAVAFVMYGGFLYITSQGEPQGVANAKSTIMNALIGLIIAITATVLVNFIGARLVG